MSLDVSGNCYFYGFIYTENFVLIVREFHPVDPQMIRSNACVRKVVLIYLILYGFVIIILNQMNKVRHVFRVRFERHSI